jgi:hypothetical protein
MQKSGFQFNRKRKLELIYLWLIDDVTACLLAEGDGDVHHRIHDATPTSNTPCEHRSGSAVIKSRTQG